MLDAFLRAGLRLGEHCRARWALAWMSLVRIPVKGAHCAHEDVGWMSGEAG